MIKKSFLLERISLLEEQIRSREEEYEKINRDYFYTRRGKPIYTSNASGDTMIPELNKLTANIRNLKLKLNRYKIQIPLAEDDIICKS